MSLGPEPLAGGGLISLCRSMLHNCRSRSNYYCIEGVCGSILFRPNALDLLDL